MLLRLLLLLTIVPIVELTLLLEFHAMLARWWGPGRATLLSIGTIFLTGVLGAFLARAQGLGVLRAIQTATSKGKIPGPELIDGAFILVGGALLLTPGLLTDAFGFSLLFPPTRMLYKASIVQWWKRKLHTGEIRVFTGSPFASKSSSFQDDVIDTTVSDRGSGNDSGRQEPPRIGD